MLGDNLLSAVQQIPLAGALIMTVIALTAAMANGWKEKQEGKRLGREQEARRNAAANAEVTADLKERAKDEQEQARRVRARIDSGSDGDGVSGEAGGPLSDWDYRD